MHSAAGYHENLAVNLSQKYDLAFDVAEHLVRNYGTREPRKDIGDSWARARGNFLKETGSPLEFSHMEVWFGTQDGQRGDDIKPYKDI